MNLHRIKAFSILLFGIVCSPFALHAQGIEFMHDLDSAIAKAKAENKIVFVDFYTSWCAPCKAMSKDVFPQEKVGTFFNPQFINCKVQCDDKGVGEELGKKYQINAYPTLMFLDKNGEMIHSGVGGLSPEGLIELAKISVNPDRNLLSLIKEWNAGNREDAFITKYFRALKSAYRYEKLNSDFITWFNELSDSKKTEKKTFDLVQYVKVNPFTPVFEYVEANHKKYNKTVGRAEIDKFISDGYLWYLKAMIDRDKRDAYEMAKAKFKAKKYPYYHEFAMFYSAFEVMDSKGGVDIKEYMKRGTAFLDKYGKNNDGYTTALTSLLGNCVGRPDEGVDGIKWMENLLARNRDPRYLSLYFYITWRNFQFEKALEIGNEMRAIAIKENKSTKQIDSQIQMVVDYREKLAKKAAAQKAN
jgi:thioredoxin-related protein